MSELKYTSQGSQKSLPVRPPPQTFLIATALTQLAQNSDLNSLKLAHHSCEPPLQQQRMC